MPRGGSRGLALLCRALGAAHSRLPRRSRCARASEAAGARGGASARRTGRRCSRRACDRAWRARRAGRADRAGPSAGRARRRAVARPELGWGAPGRAAACTRAADRTAGNLADHSGRGNRPSSSTHSFRSEQLRRLSVGPLSAGALHRLLEQRLGLELTRPELARVQEATAGNPFFALELGRELVRTGTRPAPGQALRVPDSLRELLGGRLARLPGETLDVLLQVAALARPTVEVVAAAHGNRERVLGALEAAVREGVVELDGSRVRFAHPLLASICYEEAPVWKRRAVHRALAERRRRYRGAGPPPRARRRRPRRRRRLRSRGRRRACRRPRGDRRRRRALRACRRADARRSRRWLVRGACRRRTSTASPARATGRPRCSTSS